MHAKKIEQMALMHSDALVERAKMGERDAQGKLVQAWYRRIYNFSYKYFMDHDRAMEVSQKTFIAMCRHLEGLQDASRFKSWLYKIAVNYCRDEWRRKAGNRAIPLDAVLNVEAEDSAAWEGSSRLADNPEGQYRQNELADLLQTCLLELSPEQREVVIMKEYEGLKFREIAETLNISENTAKSRMYYGLTALRKNLERRKIDKNEIGYGL
jgi:RNA polymerase sigma-70 factor, ECF subfamily